MNKYLSSIFLAASALLTVFTPQIQDLASHHTAVVATIYSVWGIINHFLPQPQK
jgi:hypothetical protein